MTQANTSSDNLAPDGGELFSGTYTTTALIRTKVLDNSQNHREKTSLYILSSQAGSLDIYDVDETGLMSKDGASVAVLAATLKVVTLADITHRIVCEFTPAAAPGTETLMIRGYVAGFGARS